MSDRLRPALFVPEGACQCDLDRSLGGRCDVGDLPKDILIRSAELRLTGRRDEAKELERREVAALNASRRASQKDIDMKTDARTVERRDVLSAEEAAVVRRRQRIDSEFRAWSGRDDRELARQVMGVMGASPVMPSSHVDAIDSSDEQAAQRARDRANARYRAFATRDDAAAALASVKGTDR